jgi:hypothetical protein
MFCLKHPFSRRIFVMPPASGCQKWIVRPGEPGIRVQALKGSRRFLELGAEVPPNPHPISTDPSLSLQATERSSSHTNEAAGARTELGWQAPLPLPLIGSTKQYCEARNHWRRRTDVVAS